MSDFQKVMEQAQKVQQEMQKAQSEISQLKIVGSSGAGAVKVTMNGQYAVISTVIADSVHQGPKDILEQLVSASFNDAVQKLERVSKERLSKLTSSIDLKGIMGPAGDTESQG